MEKIVVFDLNGTLLKRIKKDERSTIQSLEAQEIFADASYDRYYIYIRPHIKTLAEFLHTHDVNYIFWSTCTRPHLTKLIGFIKDVMYNYCGFFCQDECIAGKYKGNSKADKWVKNLEVVKRKYNKDAILVDDGIEKRFEDQPMILVKEFTGSHDDYLITLTQELHDMTDCKDLNCTYNKT